MVQDGIEYYIETNKPVYDLGEDVEILYRITNQTDEEWTVRGVGRIFDVVVESTEEEGFREVWSRYWTSPVMAPGPVLLRLQPNESSGMRVTWDQMDYQLTRNPGDDIEVGPGTYRVLGVLDLTPGVADLPYSSVGIDITVIPEPGSLWLFSLALLLARRRNRKQSG